MLPARIPQLLLNGSAGIAVGHGHQHPAYNCTELIAGLPGWRDRKLLEITDQGPDPARSQDPTSPPAVRSSAARASGETRLSGRGSVTMRVWRRNRDDSRPPDVRIGMPWIITELSPYQTNKAALTERIADLVNDKKLEGISDIRGDESDRDGMRTPRNCVATPIAQVVLNNLFKLDAAAEHFQRPYMPALVNGEPILLTLRKMLEVFLDFRVARRLNAAPATACMRKAEERDHILLGLLLALDQLDPRSSR